MAHFSGEDQEEACKPQLAPEGLDDFSDLVVQAEAALDLGDVEPVQDRALLPQDVIRVGEALIEEGLINGHTTDYGLYVDEVNGIALDWDKDGKYWAFYINGEYAQTGVDTTDVEDGAVYTFKPE